jgi:hypothetical protein
MRDNTDEERAQAALGMREDVRKKHKDLFAKTATFKTLWAYIESVTVIREDDGDPLDLRRSKRKRRLNHDDEEYSSPSKNVSQGRKSSSMS